MSLHLFCKLKLFQNKKRFKKRKPPALSSLSSVPVPELFDLTVHLLLSAQTHTCPRTCACSHKSPTTSLHGEHCPRLLQPSADPAPPGTCPQSVRRNHERGREQRALELH